MLDGKVQRVSGVQMLFGLQFTGVNATHYLQGAVKVKRISLKFFELFVPDGVCRAESWVKPGLFLAAHELRWTVTTVTYEKPQLDDFKTRFSKFILATENVEALSVGKDKLYVFATRRLAEVETKLHEGLDRFDVPFAVKLYRRPKHGLEVAGNMKKIKKRK